MKATSIKTTLPSSPRQRGIRRILETPQNSNWGFTTTRLQRLALGVAIVGVVLPIAITCWHLFDYYGLEHGAGVWISLADWADRGKLMPPVSFDGYYAGTRYMPVPIMAQQWMSNLLGSQIAGGRVVSLGGVLTLVSALLFAFRRAGLSWTPALLLVAGMVMTPTLNTAIVSIRNDAMPAALQLIALVIVVDAHLARRPRVWLMAGSLAGLAVVWKASAIWCIAAVILGAACQPHRFAELRRHYLYFLTGVVGTLVVGGGVSLIITEGRIVSNFKELMFSTEYSAVDVHLWVKPYLGGVTLGMSILAPVVFYGLLHLVGSRTVPVFLRAGVVCCVVFTTLIFVDYQGAYINHLVDLMALGLLGIAYAINAASDLLSVRQRATAMGAAVALIMTCVIGGWYEPLRGALRDGAVPAYSLDGIGVGPGQVLSENPLVNIAIGQRPVIADPFAFRRIAANKPGFDADLLRRIEHNEFSAVVMLARAGRENGSWYANGSWGDDVLDAICGSYHPVAVIGEGKFEVYLPGKAIYHEASSPCSRLALRYD